LSATWRHPAEGETTTKAFADKLEPGAIEILPPGKTITFPNMPSVQDDGHSDRSLRAIAMGFDVTYELLTGDLSNVNFSSGRMGWIEFHRNVEQWRWHMFIPRFCRPVWGWFVEASLLRATTLRTSGRPIRRPGAR
jgi:capsid protein